MSYVTQGRHGLVLYVHPCHLCGTDLSSILASHLSPPAKLGSTSIRAITLIIYDAYTVMYLTVLVYSIQACVQHALDGYSKKVM
jgi:hypothetical protein